MPPVYPQKGTPLWMDSAYLGTTDDDPIAVACAQMRWWRARGLTPADIYALLGCRYIARPRQPPGPSWDDAVWLIAEIYQRLSTRRTFGAAEEERQMVLPFRRAA